MISKKKPLVYVIILNYCSFEDTIECVKTIKSGNYKNINILVIDNASIDGSGKHLKHLLASHEYIGLKKNVGYAGGNNLGIKLGLIYNADYFFIINPDIRIPQQGLEHYIETMENDKSISALNPVQITEDSLIDEKFFGEMYSNNGHIAPSNFKNEHRLLEVKRLFGASLLLTRETVLNNGGFDPLFFAYWEEVDLCRRIAKNGGKLIITESHPVIHLRTKEKSSKPDDFILFLRLKGMYLYDLKDHELKLLTTLYKATKECLHYKKNGFNGMFAWKKKHFTKTLIWIYINFPKIAFHRYIERRPRTLYLPKIKRH